MTEYYLAVTYILAGILGLCVGSFLNVVIYRVPLKMSVAKPPSHCPNCDTVLKWYDNIPVLSYIILRGKCRYCGVKISPRYICVELLNAGLWLVCAFKFADKNLHVAVLYAIACSVFICVALIDLEYKIVPDRFNIIIAVIGILCMIADRSNDPLMSVIGGVAAFVSLYLIGLVAEKVSGTEALGGGDIKLCGAAGILLGIDRFIPAALIGSVTASVFLMILRSRRGDDKKKEYPFAPFLTFGFTVALLFGREMISAYMGLFEL